MRWMASEMRRRVRGGAVLVAVLALSACGGGDQVSSFTASRVIALGDENSVIDDSQSPGNGLKYSVNGTVSTTNLAIDCRVNPLWIQSLASKYGLVFPQCNIATVPVVAPVSRIRAQFGARAADLATQIATQDAASAFANGDLASVLVGQYDVLAQYAQYPTVGVTQLIANVEAAGAETARQVNLLAARDVRVIVSTVADLGVTPYARAQRAAFSDIDRAALLTQLSARYNAGMRAALVNDGRRVGLIVLDELVSAVARSPGLNGFTNATTGACDLSKSAQTPPSSLDCTAQTLIPNGTPFGYLWADELHLSAGGQLSLGNLAVNRAQNNPF